MNERIKELIEQAIEPPVFPANIGYFNREKFAELIVKECTGIVADAVDHREPASTYVSKIKKHFGVE